MDPLAKSQSNKPLRFGAAGVIGFLVDAGALSFILWTKMLGPFSARLVAISIALLSTWLINRLFTFGPSGRPVAQEMTRYAVIGFLGSALNYAIYASILLTLPQVWPVASLVCASAIVTIFSWLGYSKFVFQNRPI